MTKEELEKEIRKYLKKTFHHEYYDDVVKVMGFAEPREKQIQIDAEQIRALQKDKGELTDRVKEFEAQIEGMKRYLDCEYCEHYTQPWGCKNCNEEIRSDWKLKEIKEK